MVAIVATETSAARVAANRANARKSTGPRTAAGKARSRANAVKHGLTGAGVALPTEDATRVERRFVELQADMAPADMLGRVLVQQMALMSVRVERAAQHEAACMAMAIRHAAVEFDLARLAEVDRLFATIVANPAENRRRLLTTVEGVDRLADALTSAREQIREGRVRHWGSDDRAMVEAFFGRQRTFFPLSRTCALLEALVGDFRWLAAHERAQIVAPIALSGYVCTELIALIDEELSRLVAIRATLDPAIVDQDRHEAATRALFDPGRDATSARKYEAAAIRNFRRALRDFRQNEEAPVDFPPVAAEADPDAPPPPINRIAHLIERGAPPPFADMLPPAPPPRPNEPNSTAPAGSNEPKARPLPPLLAAFASNGQNEPRSAPNRREAPFPLRPTLPETAPPSVADQPSPMSVPEPRIDGS